MYKKVVGSYVKDELKSGKTIEQIRKRLMKVGYNERDVNSVLREYEFRETDLKNKENYIRAHRITTNVWLIVAIAIIIVNAVFFFYYFNDTNYVLVRETPTGLVVEDITREEFINLENSFNVSSEGLSKIS